MVIDIAARTIELKVPDSILDAHRTALLAVGGYRPQQLERSVSPALRAYAATAPSADRGAIRDVDAVVKAMAVTAVSAAPGTNGLPGLVDQR